MKQQKTHRYGTRAGLGFDWSVFGNILSAGASAGASIYNALNIPSFPTAAQVAQAQAAAPAGTLPASSLGGISPTLLLGGFGLLAVVLLAGKK